MRNWQLTREEKPPEKIAPLSWGDLLMLHDVVSATYKGGYRIEITFDNGERGVVNFSPYLERGVSSESSVT